MGSAKESKEEQSASPSYSPRNDLVRDIESLIEIIFECFETDDSMMAVTTSKQPESSSADSPTENVNASQSEKSENDSKKAESDENEKKNEMQSD